MISSTKLLLGITKRLLSLFQMFFFDPLVMLRKWLGLSSFIRNWRSYKQAQVAQSFPIIWRDVYYCSLDRFATSGQGGHYFFQDLWAARKVFEISRARVGGGYKHVDVGSRVDGFVTHLLLFCEVQYVDIRPLKIQIDGLAFLPGSVLALPLENDSCETLSCLHVIEHIGLGRYGDDVDPDGHVKAAKELIRVLKPGGTLLIGTPVGREKLCFDAHRIFDPQTVLHIFQGLDLIEFSLIDDKGNKVIQNASIEQARNCDYGCGLFYFLKPTPRSA